MEQEHTTKKEREYIRNRKLADILLGIEKGFFTRFRTRKKSCTEQEVVDAIIKCNNGQVGEADARKNINQYVGSEEYGMKHNLRKLSLLRNDTLGIEHIKTADGNVMYKIFTYSRDPSIS